MNYTSLLRNFLAVAFLFCVSNNIFAQLTPLSIGNIEPGDSIIIYYSVKINNPLSQGTTQISSQGAIGGSNFTSSSTDDPDTGPFVDATVTNVESNRAPLFKEGASTTLT